MYAACDSLGDYQDEAISFMRKNSYGALFLPMGTGKTFCVIEWLKYRKRIDCNLAFPIMIFAPKIVCNNWVQEIEKFGDGLTYLDLSDGPGPKRLKRLKHSKADIVITNYEFAGKIANQSFGTVIADESTRIKNTKAKRSKAVYALGRRSHFRWILTGSPVTRDITDIYGQTYFLDAGHLLGDSHWKFLNRYCTPIQFGPGQRGWTPKRGSVERIKHNLSPIVFKREREQCLTLPDKRYVEIKVPPTPEMERYNREILDYWRINGREMDNALSVDMALRQIACGFAAGCDSEGRRTYSKIACGKYDAIRTLIEDSVGSQQVIWTNFRAEQLRLANTLVDAGIAIDCINGSTPGSDRQRILGAFRDGELTTVAISEQVGSFGLNELANADLSIYCTNSYDLELRKQSEDRIYRAGRRNSPVYYDVLTDGSIEEHILKLLKTKHTLSKSFMRENVLQSMEASW